MIFYVLIILPAALMVVLAAVVIGHDRIRTSTKAIVLAVIAASMIPIQAYELAVFAVAMATSGLLGHMLTRTLIRSPWNAVFRSAGCFAALTAIAMIVGAYLQTLSIDDKAEIGSDVQLVSAFAMLAVMLLILVGIPLWIYRRWRQWRGSETVALQTLPAELRETLDQFCISDLMRWMVAVAIAIAVTKDSWPMLESGKVTMTFGCVTGCAVVAMHRSVHSSHHWTLRLVMAAGLLLAGPCFSNWMVPKDDIYWLILSIGNVRVSVSRFVILMSLITFVVVKLNRQDDRRHQWLVSHPWIRGTLRSITLLSICFAIFTFIRLYWFLSIPLRTHFQSQEVVGNRNEELMTLMRQTEELSTGQAERLERVREIVNSSDPVVMPFPMEFGVYFERNSHSGMRTTAREFVNASNAAAIRGEKKAATDELLTCFRFSQRITTGGLLTDRLCSIAFSTYALDEMIALRNDWNREDLVRVPRSLLESHSFVDSFATIAEREAVYEENEGSFDDLLGFYDGANETIDGIFDTSVEPSRTMAFRTQDMGYIDESRVRLIILDCAIRLYVMDHGLLPPHLDALVPKYIEKVPLDPWTGQPIPFQVTETGYRIYSVGQNETDEGGIVAVEPYNGDLVIESTVPTSSDPGS